MPNVYTPKRNAFAQSSYHDQQGTALAGEPAFASDLNLIDSFIVGDVGDNGLEAGLAIVAVPAASARRPGLNELVVTLPPADATADKIIGVVTRNQQMRTNTAGHACWFHQDICNVARSGRSGARIWGRLADNAQPEPGGAVFVAVGGDNAGTFASEAGAGFVAVPSMQFASTASDGLALVELL